MVGGISLIRFCFKQAFFIYYFLNRLYKAHFNVHAKKKNAIYSNFKGHSVYKIEHLTLVLHCRMIFRSVIKIIVSVI